MLIAEALLPQLECTVGDAVAMQAPVQVTGEQRGVKTCGAMQCGVSGLVPRLEVLVGAVVDQQGWPLNPGTWSNLRTSAGVLEEGECILRAR